MAIITIAITSILSSNANCSFSFLHFSSTSNNSASYLIRKIWLNTTRHNSALSMRDLDPSNYGCTLRSDPNKSLSYSKDSSYGWISRETKAVLASVL